MAKQSSTSHKPAPAAVKRKAPSKNRAHDGKQEKIAPDVVAVAAEQRRRLIEDIAYFQAKRYRAVEPGGYREEDRRVAEAEIKFLLEKNRK